MNSNQTRTNVSSEWAGSLTWPELSERAPAALGLLAVGAGCKEHGQHLPLNTDLVQARWIAEEVARRVNAVVWPPVVYGFYPAFRDYPGSPSIDEGAFLHTVSRVLESMAASGHRRCAVLNTGISTIGAVDSACRSAPGALAVHVYAGARFREVADRLARQNGGGHADEIETSLMLHIDAKSVRLERAEDASRTRFVAGPLNRTNPGEKNFSPSGAMGNPTLATREKGRALADAMVGDVLEAIERFVSSWQHL